MGYTTDFEGHFNLDRALALEHKTYLEKFSNTRRMKRNAILAGRLPDPVRDAAGLGIGEEGGYFVGAKGFAGEDHDSKSIIEYNDPPAGQPGLWCQWVPAIDEEGEATRIEWNGGEKFYDYVE